MDENQKQEQNEQKKTPREEKIDAEVAKLIAGANGGKLTDEEINDKLGRLDLDITEMENVYSLSTRWTARPTTRSRCISKISDRCRF